MATDATLRIKNLSISLEALSRINHEGSRSLYSTIEALLITEITAYHKEQNPIQAARSAKPPLTDDDIPF